MTFSATLRRWPAWCVLIAMLMAALAPGISRALAAAMPGNKLAWAQICTVGDGNSGNTASVRLNHPEPGHVTLHLNHCAYSHLAGAAPGSRASALIASTEATIVACQPLLFLQARRTL